MKLQFPLLAAGLFALASVAQATDLNYDYLQVGYAEVDFDDVDEDLTSVSIGGSFLVAEQIYLFGSYTDGQTDRFAGGRLESTGYTLGMGYRYGVGPQTDFNFAAAYEYADVEGTGDPHCGGLWHINEQIAVGLGYFTGSDAQGFEGGVRFKF